MYILQNILPPNTIICVGAGEYLGEIYKWNTSELATVIAINADKIQFPDANTRQHKYVLHEFQLVVAAIEEEAEYFIASNPDENGLISPDILCSIWPNLRTLSRSKGKTRRLDTLLTEISRVCNMHQGNVWGIIDCFPALRILNGCGPQLDSWSVLIVRVLLVPGHDALTELTLATVTDYLHEFGFRCVFVNEGIHPAVGYAFFTKDWPEKLRTLHFSHQEQQQHIDKIQKKMENICRERDTQAERIQKLQDQLESTQTRLQAQQKGFSTLQNEGITLKKEQGEQAILLSKKQIEIDMLQKESTLYKSTLEEIRSRYATFQEELAKAEGQIDLLKDIFFKDVKL